MVATSWQLETQERLEAAGRIGIEANELDAAILGVYVDPLWNGKDSNDGQ